MQKAKILVVEDDLFLRELYLETLRGEGYQVDTAADGVEGLKKIQNGGWDLILLDIIMPNMDGLQVMKRLKTEPPVAANKSIVFLTNLDKDDDIKEALRLGGEGYLIKSQMTPSDLLAEIKVYLQKN